MNVEERTIKSAKKTRHAKNRPQAADPWQDWGPQWRDQRSPHTRQEHLSPTETVDIRAPGERDQRQNRRRIVDARLWDAMDAEQQRAALEIVMAFQSMSRGLGYASSDWTRLPGGRGINAGDLQARLMHDYIDWTKRCHKESVSHSMVIDVLVYGFTCQMIDRDRRVRTGTTRKNLMDGLTLYAEIRGWKKS